MKATRKTRPIVDRMFPKLQTMPSGCIEFTGKRLYGDFPYGIISQTSQGVTKEYRTHRVVWEMTHGPIPDGMQILHRCDNPPCCNPDHLRVGSMDDNMRDMAEKNRSHYGRRTHCGNGHEFTPENTRPRVDERTGRTIRRCRACVRLWGQQKSARRRAA